MYDHPAFLVFSIVLDFIVVVFILPYSLITPTVIWDDSEIKDL